MPQFLGQWIRDCKAPSLSPGQSAARLQPWASCSHTHVLMSQSSIIWYYNLVPAKQQWCTIAGKVTVVCRSGIALAIRHRFCGWSTYRFSGHDWEMSIEHSTVPPCSGLTRPVYLIYVADLWKETGTDRWILQVDNVAELRVCVQVMRVASSCCWSTIRNMSLSATLSHHSTVPCQY